MHQQVMQINIMREICDYIHICNLIAIKKCVRQCIYVQKH